MKINAFLTTLLLFTVAALAQSPNTASITVAVSDQTGRVLEGAKISATNAMTGTARSIVSGADGSATITGLPLTGTYELDVQLAGFNDEVVKNVELRAAETATFRVNLPVGSLKSEVVVYGTAEGVRSGDGETGTLLNSSRIDDTPVLGRKITALPLLSAAFRPAKGTGDLFINSIYFVSGAGGRRQPDYVVDGATADEPWGRQTIFSTLPAGAIQEMNVQSRAISPEFGWTSSAALNIVTKSGTNTTHGELMFLGRPGGLQAKTLGRDAWCPKSISTCVAPSTPIIPADVPDALAQGSAALGGPIIKNKTHYFVAADFTKQDRTAPITTPLVAHGTTYLGEYGQALIDARLDHVINPTNTLMARFNLDCFYDTNPQDAVSGNVLPNAGRRFARHAYSGQINETASLSPFILNEARFVWLDADPVTAFDPLTPSTQFTRAGAGPFTSGESRYAHIFSRQGQFSDTLSWTAGRHYVRAGGNIARSVSGGDGTEFGSAFVLGQFTVNSATTARLNLLRLADMTRYQQSFNLGQGTYTLAQWIFAGFVQDHVRMRNDLYVDLGLRYDRQTFSDSTTNFAPRAGFGWNPKGSPDLTIRGGYGMYYTLLRANNAPNFTLGGPQGIFTYQAAPGQTGFPSCLTCTPVPFDANAAAATLPARNITIRPRMASTYAQFFNVAALPGYAAATFENPRSQVGSIGFERRLGPKGFVSADYMKQHWTKLDQTVDLNAPSVFVRTAPGQIRTVAAADATRPLIPVNGGFRTINVVESIGVADYDGLQTAVRWQNSRVSASVSYTLSRATNSTEPDGNGAGPNDFNQLGPQFEKGPSLLDQRHRAVVNFSYRFPYRITAGTLTQIGSARPFNPTTGNDNNGDGNNNDRPVIAGQIASRYSFRGTPLSDAAVFVESRINLSDRTAVLLRAEGFNVLNHANILARNGTYGDTGTPLPTFGNASPGLASIDPARMFQFQLRLMF